MNSSDTSWPETAKRAVLPVYRQLRRYWFRGLGYLDWLQSPLLEPHKTVVITGFWRSGTTWVQQGVARSVRGKTFYEPFQPAIPEYRQALPESLLPEVLKDQLDAFVPWLPGKGTLSQELLDYLSRVLAGTIPDHNLRLARHRAGEAWSRRPVVKFVRGHLSHPYFRTVRQWPVLHVRRDPRAVLASVTRNDWGRWLYDLSLSGQLLEPPDGRADYFETWTDTIRRYDERDRVSKITAYWCLLEIFVAQRQRAEEPGRLLVPYEDLLGNPADVSTRIQTFLRNHTKDSPDPPAFSDRIDSPTTTPGRRDVSNWRRRVGWKQELSSQDREAVESTVIDFKCEDWLDSEG